MVANSWSTSTWHAFLLDPSFVGSKHRVLRPGVDCVSSVAKARHIWTALPKASPETS